MTKTIDQRNITEVVTMHNTITDFTILAPLTVLGKKKFEASSVRLSNFLRSRTFEILQNIVKHLPICAHVSILHIIRRFIVS